MKNLKFVFCNQNKTKNHTKTKTNPKMLETISPRAGAFPALWSVDLVWVRNCCWSSGWRVSSGIALVEMHLQGSRGRSGSILHLVALFSSERWIKLVVTGRKWLSSILSVSPHSHANSEPLLCPWFLSDPWGHPVCVWLVCLSNCTALLCFISGAAVF